MKVPHRDIIVLGGSAGGIEALEAVLPSLPADLPAALFIVLHRRPDPGNVDSLVDALRDKTPLTVCAAQDEQPFERGHAYVAPADLHLLLENGVLRLERSPPEGQFRPAINVLFKSAAAAYGHRVVGVLFSGVWGEDGTAGLWQIKHHGGVTMVQNPDDARFDALPRSALDHLPVDHVLPARWIGPKLIELTSPEEAFPEETGPRPARILIVEDEGIVAANLQRSLAEMGYDPFDWTTSGEEAITIAQREEPDLVLTDIGLAGKLTGIEAARHIWQTLQIPVVYCTAQTDGQTLQAVQGAENYGYVVKPCHGEAVRAAIELALARRERELRQASPVDA